MVRKTESIVARNLHPVLSARLPDLKSSSAVFSVICLALYGWTIMNFSWMMRSFLFNLNSWEIFSIFSYLMVFNLIESGLVMLGLLGLCFVLPGRWLKENFVARGVIIVVCMLASMILHLMVNSADDSLRIRFNETLRIWWASTAILIAFLVWFLPRFPIVVRALDEFADRVSVFLYIFVPLSMLGFVVIVIRFFFMG